jgi:hypothetical protein
VEGRESAAKALLGGGATTDASSGATAEVRLINHQRHGDQPNLDLTGDTFLLEPIPKQYPDLLVYLMPLLGYVKEER